MTGPVASAGVSQRDQPQPVCSGSEEAFGAARNQHKGKAAAAGYAPETAHLGDECLPASSRMLAFYLLTQFFK